MTTATAIKESNDLRFSATRRKGNLIFDIKIGLNDECKNGHQDFHITGSMYEGKRTERSIISCGSIGDVICKHYPEFQIFQSLHGCDYLGRPTYAAANMFFHVREGMDKGKFTDYYNLTFHQTDMLYNCVDELQFRFVMESLGVLDQWKEMADEAISDIENLTGQKFIIDSKRSQYTPLTDGERKAIEVKIDSGYYTDKEIIKRKKAKNMEDKAKKIKSIKDGFNKTIKKERDSKNVALYVANFDHKLDNFIYYNHTNTLVFNWSDSSYRNNISKEQFADFVMNCDYSKLPEGININKKY